MKIMTILPKPSQRSSLELINAQMLIDIIVLFVTKSY